MTSSLPIVIIVIALLLALVSLVGGIFCLVLYAKTRRIVYLIVGLALTFILPGLIFCLALGVFIPSTMVAYGPPPDYIP
jgi:hypothetical protein